MTDIFNIAGRVAIVTGASQALGRQSALSLAAHGARVCLAARSAANLRCVVENIRARGGDAMTTPLDVLDRGSIDAAVADATNAFGLIDILVNNAGIAVTKSFLDQTEADWDAVVGTNLKGAFLVAQAVARQMSIRGTGSIINIASVLGYGTIGQLTPYVASKGGLIQMTRNMALELARYGIRVNTIAPGYIDTDMTREFFTTPPGQTIIAGIPQRRLGQQGDLNGPLLLLASDASRYMTGSVVLVDGGYLLS